mgnify:CR=1 FL=1
MTGISVLKSIYKLLVANEDLVAMVDNKMFPLIANENTSFPFIVYQRDSIYTEYTKDGKYCDNINISINIAATTYNQSIEIAELVRSSIEGKRIDNINTIRLISMNEDYLEDTYIQNLQFNVIYQF